MKLKALKTFLIVISVIQWGCYIGKTFVLWEFTNPFQWIIDMPTYSEDARLLIYIFGLSYGIITYGFCYLYHESKKNEQ